VDFTRTVGLLLFYHAISRTTVSRRDQWNGASACRTFINA
jgi:hypothetical protein